MTKQQLLKQLNILHKELTLADNRLWKISTKLSIPENNDIKNLLAQVSTLIEIGEQYARRTEN